MAEEELEMPIYTVSSLDLLEAMIHTTDLMEKVAKGEISIEEALAIYQARILPVIEEIREKAKAKQAKKAAKKKAKKTKTTKSKKAKKSKAK